MTSQPRDKTRDSTKHDTAKFGIDLYMFRKKLQRGSTPLEVYWSLYHRQI